MITFFLIAQVTAFTACAQSAHQTGQAGFDKLIPPDLREQIDRSVTLAELQAHPEQYEGRTVMLGGSVLSSKRLKDRTEIEILELPMTEGLLPAADRMRSRGRFLAVKTEFLDPATVRPGSLVTVVGKVMGTVEKALDETMYTYPVLEILNVTDWERVRPPYGYSAAAPYPYSPYPYYGDYYGRFYGGYGRFGSWPYYGPYYPYHFGLPAAPPSPGRSRGRVPPQFQK
jgi:outer membrane lipoprotein